MFTWPFRKQQADAESAREEHKESTSALKKALEKSDVLTDLLEQQKARNND